MGIWYGGKSRKNRKSRRNREIKTVKGRKWFKVSEKTKRTGSNHKRCQGENTDRERSP